MKKFEDQSQNVTKYVFESDDACYEAVLYRYPTYAERTVLCISTQCGCPVGCNFCGTGKKFIRNLTNEEIVDQVYEVLCDIGMINIAIGRIGMVFKPKRLQIMFMSMGEPFLNYMDVMAAIEELNNLFDCELLISTIGPNKPNEFNSFLQFSKEIPAIGLQFSIHESSDYQRNQLIPYKNKLNLRQIRDYGIEWYATTGRKVYLNYCVNGSNNDNDDAKRLMDLFSPTAFAFTFSVVCSADETMKDAADRNIEEIEQFQELFLNNGYNTRVFDPAGQDTIGGGCGQLWYVQQWMTNNGK